MEKQLQWIGGILKVKNYSFVLQSAGEEIGWIILLAISRPAVAILLRADIFPVEDSSTE